MTHEFAPAAPTLEQVAALAGVSRSTVSRVVNNSPHVTNEAASAVLEAIETLGYVPNRAARSLASRKTQVIALVVPESTARVFADPFFASVVQGVALHLAQTEYTLNMVIASETNPDKTRRYLMGGNVDGALVVSHHRGDHSYARLSQTLPTVFGGRPMSAEERDSYFVDTDNVAGAVEATRHLLDLGCRSLATIAGPQDMPAGFDRLLGWRTTLIGAGLDSSLVEEGDFTPGQGAEAMRRLLDRGVPFDGLFVANDQMAVGALSVLRDCGIAVPDSLAVVGFDGDYFGQSSDPPLSTVAQPSTAMGAKMAEVLVDLLEGRPVERVTIMPTELIVRGSTRR
ncbi:MAG: LacI family transcriptional regulator [Naasia sp.]|jgi:DNA-binding LacI/PurR family transcriptional regulator|uniref:LacI family DNA-binding transcriptional regulator n=1 Tax=Naasia sp. TaxID=2546198 RepID=UPI00262D3B2C|nr:LacI family DNA-binding transcriptional regulator [Naasia sp.]MCU1570203.1 LacI family transcriptional regulator [Naasia sp.]